jgi:PHD/YefM family antitoxin component YafN of YafNO toxin-antitoxin module
VERYITDEQGERKAVILDIEDFKALTRAAEDADDIRAVNEIRRQLGAGGDEMIDYREARQEWQPTHSPERAEGER